MLLFSGNICYENSYMNYKINMFGRILFLHFNKPIALQGLASNYDNIYWKIKSLNSIVTPQLLNIQTSSVTRWSNCVWSIIFNKLIEFSMFVKQLFVLFLRYGIHDIHVTSKYRKWALWKRHFPGKLLNENFYNLYIVNCQKCWYACIIQ